MRCPRRNVLRSSSQLEDDPHINPLGTKGLAEICIVGVAAAIANAVYHATGKRIRTLPMTLDTLLEAWLRKG